MSKSAYAILPYRELIEITKQFSEQHNLVVLPDEKNVESAIPAALRAEKDGARVIISRGGTAEIIKKHVRIPVVDIRVSDLDILRALYPLKGLNKKILVVGYRDAVLHCRSVAEILNLETYELMIPYEKAEYNFDNIKCAASRMVDMHGIDTIIGDQTAFLNLGSICESLYLIKSGREDVIEAIEKTENTLSVRFGKNFNNSHMKNVLDSVNDAVILADNNGVVTIFNSEAEKIFKRKREEVLGLTFDMLAESQDCFTNLKTPVRDVIWTGQSCGAQTLRSCGCEFRINISPIMTSERKMGAVIVMRGVAGKSETEPKEARKPLANGFSSRYTFDDILSVDESFKRKIQIASEYASSDAAILIEGESGTGKELFAQSIHSASSRRYAPFIAVNCAAIPAQLLESELFGYADGAFTGAARRGKKGLFELANTGTIFLDEISEIDKSLQVKFLRVLEEKQIMRIGSDSSFTVDVRVVAATNCDLRKLVMEGCFRPDLYYRLNLLNLRIPALREHREDIEFLARHFYSYFSKKYSFREKGLSPEIISVLKKYSWPGNVRELKNIMERSVLVSGGGNIDLSFINLISGDLYGIDEKTLDTGSIRAEGKTLAEIKYNAAVNVLKGENYNKSRAAEKLGIDRSTLERILGSGTKHNS